MDDLTGSLFDKDSKGILKIETCFICKGWHLPKDLSLVEVPDQAGWVEKKACQVCLNKIGVKEG